MKKLIGTVAVAALLATAAFAELNMGAWVRTVVAPVAGNGEDILSGWSNSWGYGIRNARISFNFASEDGKIGMQYDVFGDGASGFGSGDYRAGWYKPADWVKFMVGHIDNGYTMRSDLSFGSWNWLRPNNWVIEDEGLTFNLGNADALQVEFFPVEGLQILGRFSMPANGGFQEAYKMFETSTFAIGYTIGSVGTIKAAWNGNGSRFENDDYKYLGDVQAAFDLTGVENLYITLGAKVSIATSDYRDIYYANSEEDNPDCFKFIKAALGASYQILDNLKISASFGTQTYSKSDIGIEVKHKPDFQFGVGLDVGLTDTLSLTADFRGLFKGDIVSGDFTVKDPKPQFSFLVGLDWAFSSNGQLGIGFEGSTGACGILANANSGIAPAKDKDNAFCWAVPLKFGYWF